MNETRRKILIVEDSETQAMKMQHILESEGWDVECAHTGEEALELMANGKPDLIIVDFYLPGIHGDVLCRQIRMNVETRQIPVLMLTNEETNAVEQQWRKSGADDYLSKSAYSDVLLQRIRKLLL